MESKKSEYSTQYKELEVIGRGNFGIILLIQELPFLCIAMKIKQFMLQRKCF